MTLYCTAVSSFLSILTRRFYIMNPANEPDSKSHWFYSSGKRARPYERQIVIYTFLWALSFLVCMYSLENELVVKPYSWVVALIPLVTFIAPLRAYSMFLMCADELVRKIQLESIVVSFAVGWLYVIGRTTLEATGMELTYADYVLVLVPFSYIFAVIFNTRRYR